MENIKGYKVFNSDWTCRNKQYTCPGKFEEDVELDVCSFVVVDYIFVKKQRIVLIIMILIRIIMLQK